MGEELAVEEFSLEVKRRYWMEVSLSRDFVKDQMSFVRKKVRRMTVAG